MNLIEFKAQMEVITQTFGAAEYPPPKLNIIWEHCKDLDVQQFKQIVRFFLESKSVKYPPLPAEFRDQAIIQRKSSFKEPKKQTAEIHPAELESSKATIKQILAKYGVSSMSELTKKWGNK